MDRGKRGKYNFGDGHPQGKRKFNHKRGKGFRKEFENNGRKTGNFDNSWTEGPYIKKRKFERKCFETSSKDLSSKRQRSDLAEYLIRLKDDINYVDVEELSSKVSTDLIGQEREILNDFEASVAVEHLVHKFSWESTSGLRTIFQSQKRHSRVEEALIKSIPDRKGEGLQYLIERAQVLFEDVSYLKVLPDRNFLARTILQSLADSIVRLRQEQQNDSIKSMVEKCEQSLEQIADNFIENLDKFLDSLNSNNISALIQSLIASISKLSSSSHITNLCNELIRLYFTPMFTDSTKESSESFLRLFECVLVHCPPPVYNTLYTLSKPHFENMKWFTLGKFFKNVSRDKFLEVFDDFKAYMESNLLLVAEVADACVRLGTKQGDLIKLLKNSYHCDESQLLLCVLYDKPFNSLPNERDSLQTNLYGSLTLQKLFLFKKPTHLLKALTPENLEFLSMNPKGSRIFNSIFENQFISLKTKQTIVNQFNGKYRTLACDKFGSYTFDSFWSVASGEQKLAMIKELNRTLFNSKWGKIVAHKIQLELFTSDPAKWKNIMLTN